MGIANYEEHNNLHMMIRKTPQNVSAVLSIFNNSKDACTDMVLCNKVNPK